MTGLTRIWFPLAATAAFLPLLLSAQTIDSTTPRALAEVLKRFHSKTPYAIGQEIKKGALTEKRKELNAALNPVKTPRGKVRFYFREARAGQWGYQNPKRTTTRTGVYVVLQATVLFNVAPAKRGEFRILQFGHYPGASAVKLEPIVAHLAGYTDHKGKSLWEQVDSDSGSLADAWKESAVGWFVDRNLHVGNARTKKSHVYPFYGMPAFNYRGNLQAWSSRLIDEPWVAIVDAPSMPVALAKEQKEKEIVLPFHAAVVELDAKASSEYEKVGTVLAVLKWGFAVNKKGEVRFLKPMHLDQLPDEAARALARWNRLRTDTKRGTQAVDFPKSKSPNAVRTYPRKHFVTLKLVPPVEQ